MTRRDHTAIGVDIGATTIKLSLVDPQGTIVVRDETRTPQAFSAAEIVAAIIRRNESDIADRYQGRAWCDSTEHDLNRDVMTGRHTLS